MVLLNPVGEKLKSIVVKDCSNCASTPTTPTLEVFRNMQVAPTSSATFKASIGGTCFLKPLDKTGEAHPPLRNPVNEDDCGLGPCARFRPLFRWREY